MYIDSTSICYSLLTIIYIYIYIYNLVNRGVYFEIVKLGWESNLEVPIYLPTYHAVVSGARMDYGLWIMDGGMVEWWMGGDE